MIQKDKTKRIFCRKDGKDLFCIQLIYFGELNYFDVYTSLDCYLCSDKKANVLIRQIIDINISDVDRNKLIDKLIVFIQEIPDIEQYYFPDYLLNYEGRFMDFYFNVIREIIFDKEFPDYTAFSQNQNTFYFELFRQDLQMEIKENSILQVEKKQFEELILNNQDLAKEYVDWLSPKAQFFMLNIFGKINHEMFVMAEQNKVVLFFVREIL